jgi:hypothetical protein
MNKWVLKLVPVLLIIIPTFSQVTPSQLQDLMQAQLVKVNDKTLDNPPSNPQGSNRALAVETVGRLCVKFNKNGMNTDAVVDAMSYLLLHDPIPEVRKAAAWVLGVTKNSRGVASLTKALSDSSLRVQLESACSIMVIDSNSSSAVRVLARIATANDFKSYSAADFIKAGEEPNDLEDNSKGRSTIATASLRWRLKAINGLAKSHSTYSQTVLKTLRNDSDLDVSTAAKNAIK